MAKSDDPVLAAEAQSDLKRLDDEKARRSRSPRKSLAPGRMKPTSEQLRARTAEIRAYVDDRDPYCVICREPAPEPWEMHHADSGTGKTQRQTKRNCFKTHEGCHKRAHRGDLPALWALRNYARDLGYSETVTDLQRRIDKVCEARAATTRKETL
jgi:hypothetical protein